MDLTSGGTIWNDVGWVDTPIEPDTWWQNMELQGTDPPPRTDRNTENIKNIKKINFFRDMSDLVQNPIVLELQIEPSTHELRF